MAQTEPTPLEARIVEQEVFLSLDDLCRACAVQREEIVVLVEEGVLEPGGAGPDAWQFGGPSLRRAGLPYS